MKRILYLFLKKDIIRKLKKKGYGSQFIDNVMEALDIPSNLMDNFYKYDPNADYSRINK